MAETVCYQQGMHLGRTFDLKQMQPGLDIFSEETLTKSKTTDNHQTSITYSVIENNKDVKDVLGVDGAFVLKVKAGLCKVQGKGEYLKTQRSKNNTVEILASAHVETMTETLTDTKPLPDWRDHLIGTHYIRSITYGGDMIASTRIEGNNESNSKEIKAKVDAGLTLTGVIDVEAKGKFKQLEEDLKSVSRITISYFSTSLQGAMPRDINGMLVALDGFKDQVLKSNDDRGVPLTCELLPLNVLDSSIPQTLKNKALDVQLAKLDDYYEDILQAKSVLERALEEDDLEFDSAQETEALCLEESIGDMMAVFNNVIANLDITTSKGESDGSSQIAPAFEVYKKYKKQPGSYQRKVTRFLESLQSQKSSTEVPTTFNEENNIARLMQPYDNIEDLISPAPLFIALLGQLILMSLETDLSLIGKDDSPPKYLTHPNSLRASLLQVCRSGWDALNLAHMNMDAIRLKTASIPSHINDSVKIVVTGTTEEMEVILPKALKNIKSIAADCTKKAQDVERKFVDVMQVISELLKLCAAKRGAHEKGIQENKATFQAAEASRVQMEEAEANLKEMKEYIRQSREAYNKALDEMPSAEAFLGMSILEKAANRMTDAVQMVSNPMRRLTGAAVDESTMDRKRSKKEGKYADQFDGDDLNAPDKLSEADVRKLTWSLHRLKSAIGTLLVYFYDGKENTSGDKVSQVKYLKAQTKQLMDRKKKHGDSVLSLSVSSGIEQTMALIEDVVKFETSMSQTPEDFQKMQKRAEDLDGAIKMMSFQLDTQSASMPTTATPMRPGPSVTSQSSVDAAVSQDRMKCEQTSLVMRQSMENYNAANKRTQEANRETAALVAEISRMNLRSWTLKQLEMHSSKEYMSWGK